MNVLGRAGWKVATYRGARTLAVGATALVIAAGLVKLGGRAVDDPWPVGTARNSRCWRYKSAERSFAKKMNKARKGHGRRKMSLDPELSKVARVHAKEMLHRNLLYHTSSGQLRQRVTGWSTLGENVGVGYAVKSLHKAFMHSPPHRHNILHASFRHSGVGVVAKRGRMWVTVIFEARNNPSTRLKMPRC
jgi:Cysteine-rich secretory protein family